MIFALWILLISVVTIYLWIRPDSFFKNETKSPTLSYLFLATGSAVLLFISYFALGVILSVWQLEGKI